MYFLHCEGVQWENGEDLEEGNTLVTAGEIESYMSTSKNTDTSKGIQHL